MTRRGVYVGLKVALGVLVYCGALQGEAPRFKGDTHWDCYGDFLYMNRSSLHGISLVQENSVTVIDSKSLVRNFKFEPGYRAGVIYMPTEKHGFEGNFMYLQPWEGTKSAIGNQSLSFPFFDSNYDEDFTNADEADASYEARFWDVELNFWRYFTERRSDYFGLSGLVGFRFFHWDELFKLWMITPPDRSCYKIKTENRILGLQLGLDFQMHPSRWLTWDLLAKGGAFANSAEQSQFLGDVDNVIVLRDSSSQKWQPGFYGNVSAHVGIECRKWLTLRAGYEVLFLTGLALAPEQVSKAVDNGAGKRDRTYGGGVIQGLLAGLTLHF